MVVQTIGLFGHKSNSCVVFWGGLLGLHTTRVCVGSSSNCWLHHGLEVAIKG